MAIMDVNRFARELADRLLKVLQKDGMDIAQVDVEQEGLWLNIVPRLANGYGLPGECVDAYYRPFCDMLKMQLYEEEPLLNDMSGYIASILRDRYLKFEVAGLYRRLEENKETVLQNVYPYLIKREGNEEYLKDKAWRPFLNLAVTYRVQLQVLPCEVKVGRGEGNILVTLSFLEEMGITEEELYSVAVKNTEADFCMREMMNAEEFLEDEFECYLSSSANDSPLVMYLMGTETGQYGSCSILAESKIREFANEKGLKSFYLLPTSIHDFLVVTGDNVKKENLKSLLELIYELYVVEAEQLIDSVYLFDVKTGFRVV